MPSTHPNSPPASSWCTAAAKRLLPAAIMVAGLLGAGWMMQDVGLHGIAAVLANLTPVDIATIAAWHLLCAAVLGLSWRAVWTAPPGVPLGGIPALIWARMVRDAGGDVLPLSQAGGFVIGGRAAVLAGFPAIGAAATTTADVTLETASQIVYGTIGALLYTSMAAEPMGTLPIALIVLGAAAAIGGFVLVQINASRLAARLPFLERALDGILQAQQELRAIYAAPTRWGLGLLLHLAGWFCLAGGTWLTLTLMGHPIPYRDVVAMEGLVSAARSMAFMVPGAFGVQEGALVALGTQAGLDPATALSISLVKRARDFGFGIPALLSWQLVESSRARHKMAQPSAPNRDHDLPDDAVAAPVAE